MSSKNPEVSSTPTSPQAELVLANTVSRLGCTVAEARKHLGWGEPKPAQPSASQPPTSKSAPQAKPEDML